MIYLVMAASINLVGAKIKIRKLRHVSIVLHLEATRRWKNWKCYLLSDYRKNKKNRLFNEHKRDERLCSLTHAYGVSFIIIMIIIIRQA